MKEKFIALLTFTSSLRNFGTKFIRVAILVVFVWIGGLKYFHYEADGIVPFVANSPFMSFFYAKEAPEYKNFKNPEATVCPASTSRLMTTPSIGEVIVAYDRLRSAFARDALLLSKALLAF